MLVYLILGLLLAAAGSVARLPAGATPPPAMPVTVPDILLFKPVPINDAGRDVLMTVHGIGPRLADRILAARRAGGGFARMEDLLAVRGIGPRTLRVLRQRFVIDRGRASVSADSRRAGPGR